MLNFVKKTLEQSKNEETLTMHDISNLFIYVFLRGNLILRYASYEQRTMSLENLDQIRRSILARYSRNVGQIFHYK